jgi:hypothetical protein
MDRDRIWSRIQTGQRGGTVELPPTCNGTELGTSGVDAAWIARLEVERDEALTEAQRMRRAYEVARQTAVQERDEAQAEIEQLRRALEIARHAIESERDMARRERERLAAQLKAQQKLAEEHVRPGQSLWSWLFGGFRPRDPVRVRMTGSKGAVYG